MYLDSGAISPLQILRSSIKARVDIFYKIS